MLGEDYTLEYLPLFDEELSEAVRYISVELKNPDAAARRPTHNLQIVGRPKVSSAPIVPDWVLPAGAVFGRMVA